MPDFIHRRHLSLPGVQPIRGVEYQAVLDPHVLVGMHYSRWNHDHRRRIEAGIENLPDAERRRFGPADPRGIP